MTRPITGPIGIGDCCGDTPVSVYGNEWQTEIRQDPINTTSSTPQVYLELTTPVLEGGTYEVSGFLLLSGSNANTGLEMDLVVDGVSRGGPSLETGLAGGRYIFSGTAPEVFAPGVHVLQLRFLKIAGGAGSATALYANIIVKRAI